MTGSNEQHPIGRFFTIADAAELLQVSPSEVFELVTSGELPAIRVGSRRLWRIEDVMLDAYIEAKYSEARIEINWQSDDANVIDFATALRPLI